jgi:hypothetical protein
MPQLRSHPEISGWPPAWGGSYRGSDELPIGEVGVLVAARLFEGPRSQASPYISIEITYKGNRASAILTSQNHALMRSLLTKLQALLGQEISTVGDLVLD